MKSIFTLFLLSLVVVGSVSAQQRIRLGQSLQGQLDTGSLKLDDGSYYDLYRYDSPGNETVVLVLESDDFDAYLMVGTLNDGTFTSMAMDDDGGGGTNSRLEVALEKAGTYYFRANTFEVDQTGSYTIRLSALDSAPSGRMLTLDEHVSGTLTSNSLTASDESYYDAYLIRGVPNTTVTITLESFDFDAYLVIGLAGDDFESLGSDDDGAGGTNSRLVFTFNDSAIYEIRANAYSTGEAGSYSLTISSETTSAANSDYLRSMKIGSSLAGTLNGASQRLNDDSYYEDILLTGETNATVKITQISNDFDSFLNLGEIVNNEFIRIASNNDCPSESTTTSCITYTFDDNGTYVIRANTMNEGETGDFTINISQLGTYSVRDINSLPALRLGRSSTAELKENDPILPGSSRPFDDYQISLRSGDTIKLRLTTDDDLFPVLILLDSMYEQIDFSDDYGVDGTTLIKTIGQTGTYVVRVTSQSSDWHYTTPIGKYTLRADKN